MLETAARVFRAVATNQVARWLPSLYVRLTGQTGRGDPGDETPDAIAGYFRRCVDDYFEVLGIAISERSGFLDGKVLLEYGPGDIPGVALLLVAMGAEQAFCVDRFPLVSMSDKNRRVIECLRTALSDAQRRRFDSCLRIERGSNVVLLPERIKYVVRPGGLSGIDNSIDLVISRAVLEHVGNLDSTFADMIQAMRPGAVAVHQVDLKSHGLHRETALDFLVWPPALWDLMYSHKGVPNRWRVDHYRRIVDSLPVELVRLDSTARASAQDVAAVRGRLSGPFSDISDEDLAWLGFWLVFRKTGS